MSFVKDSFTEQKSVGGANVIDKINCNEKYGFDKNKYLIALLKRVQENKPLHDEVSKELYDKARISFNSGNTTEFEDWQIGTLYKKIKNESKKEK